MPKHLIFPVLLFVPIAAEANDTSLTAYFDNDSINPFRFVDAYETHNMGLEYRTGAHRVAIEAAIVSPDMIVYSNVYREANRSYGELLRFRYIRELEVNELDLELGGYVSAAGEFELDRIGVDDLDGVVGVTGEVANAGTRGDPVPHGVARGEGVGGPGIRQVLGS